MSGEGKVTIPKLPTGVPGLDEITGGGLPEFSFNVIAGGPGCALANVRAREKSERKPAAPASLVKM